MNNYKIYITKAKSGLFVGFTNDYNIAIEEKSEEKAFEVVSTLLKSFIIEDVKDGKKVTMPKPTSFDQIQLIIDEYKINSPLIIREISKDPNNLITLCRTHHRILDNPIGFGQNAQSKIIKEFIEEWKK